MNAYTMFRCFLATGLLLAVGCGEVSGTTEVDAGGSGGAAAGDAGINLCRPQWCIWFVTEGGGPEHAECEQDAEGVPADCHPGTCPTTRAACEAIGTTGLTANDAGAGTGGAGTGGSSAMDMGAGGIPAATDAGTGGSVSPGTGGAQGSGGMTGGSGGATGTGGAPMAADCVDPMGWKIQSPGGCVTANANLKKNGHVCRINCRSVQPSGASGNYIGPPFHAECITPLNSDDPGYLCVAACSECS